jgi:hypothetical protein
MGQLEDCKSTNESNSISQFVKTVQTNIQGITAEAWPICFPAGLLNLWKMRNGRFFNNKQVGRRQLLWQVAEDIRLWSCRSPKLQTELEQ